MSEDAGEPFVSVVMAVYNGAAFIDHAMASLLAQTYTNLEFVIVDDGSTDAGAAMLREYAARDPRIRLHAQANAGLTRALILGVALARGELIARMDVDDYSYPDRIARQVAALHAAPEAVAATCRLRYVGGDGSAVVGRPVDDPALLAWYLVFYNRLAGHGQTLFRRAAYTAAGGYDPDFRFAQDHDLWARMTALGPIIGVDDVLYDYRRAHAGSIAYRNRSAQAECSLRVSRRTYEALTGRPIKRRDAEDARAFWVSNNALAIGPDRARAIDGVLRSAFAAFASSQAPGAARTQALRAAIAMRWLHWAARTRLSLPVAVLRYTALALAWRPGLAPQAARLLAGRAWHAVKRVSALHRARRAILRSSRRPPP